MHQTVLSVAFLIALEPSLCATGLDVQGVFDVADKAQLFIDRTLVRETENVSLTLHQGKKHPENPVVKPDQPWEGWRLELMGTVLYDEQEKHFKMWYWANGRPDYGIEAVVCYATSKEGVRWDKPLVGTLPTKNGKPTNAVTLARGGSVMKDTRDPDPTRRYKMVGWIESPNSERGYRMLISPDGLHWTTYGKRFAHQYGKVGDVITCHWDRGRGLYVAFLKNHYQRWRGHTRRLFHTATSKDFRTWTTPVLSWKTDQLDDDTCKARLDKVRYQLDRQDNPALMRTEYYGIGAYVAESCTIGFPWIFTINNNARYGNQEGPAEIQLAVSRDLYNWERPFRTPVIAHGKQGAWDATWQCTASYAIRVGDEIRLYYAGGNFTHGTPQIYRLEFKDGKYVRLGNISSAIGLVTWKLDRFVSVDGPAEGGILRTIPVKFKGSRLEINAATKGPDGRIVVEILDAAAWPIEGVRPSDRFKGDALRHVVTFRGNADVSRFEGRPISLRFHLKNAELYSFAFRQPQQEARAMRKGKPVAGICCKHVTISNAEPRE